MIWSEDDKIHTDYGLINGKRQQSVKVAEPKNVGKSNETSADMQAMREAQAMWVYKSERKYRGTIADAEKDVLKIPMLAHKFEGSKKKKLKYPVMVQPKLDGLRCVAERSVMGNIFLLSRSTKEYNCSHISEELKEIIKHGTTLDGELYIHGTPLQTITSLVKRPRDETRSINYCVYDVPIFNGVSGTWESRHKNLMDLAKEHPARNYVKFVRGIKCDDEEQVIAAERMFVAKGYEGAIVRSMDGEYIWGYRSADLLKVKTFQTEEFPVIGFTDGVGKCVGAVIWKCRTEDEKEFDVVPMGTMEQRKIWYKNGSDYVGKPLTVKFFNYTPDGIPFHPNGVAFRIEEDM